MQFKTWLENEFPWQKKKIPVALQGLAAEARKAGSLENFVKDFASQIKHGTYWHWTDDPNFQIDPTKGPRDMSSMGSNSMNAGKLMITSHLDYWAAYGPGGKGRPFAALIDMSNVPRDQYYQVSRGFGNEFFVSDPSQARVVRVLPRNRAFSVNREYAKYIPQSFEQLEDFYKTVTNYSVGT